MPRLVRAQASSSSSAVPIHGDDARWKQVSTLAADRARIIAAVVESVTEGWRAERGAAPLPPRPPTGPLDPAREAIKLGRWQRAMATGDQKKHPQSGVVLVEPPGSPYAGRERVRKVCEPFRVVQGMFAPGGSRNPQTPGGPYSRVEFELTFASPGPIEELFNHPAGLRGHYYDSVAAGDAFTHDLITALRPILTTIRDEWTQPSPQDQWLYAPGDFATALAGGKVWMEPWASAGTLKGRGLGNDRWMNRSIPASRRIAALRVRQGFIAALLAAEQNVQANVDAFLMKARGNMPDDNDDDEGLLGPDATSIEGNDWLAQDQGALFMGASSSHVLLIKGEFLADGNAVPWFPLRKKYNSLSLHWIGYS